jgi:5'-3' exonuclease
MLSLTSHNANIVLMRESQDFGHFCQGSKTKVPFKYLVINKLRTIICETLTIDEEQPNNNAIIDDYVFICILLGNDFVPALSFLKIKEGAVDILINMYKQIKSTIYTSADNIIKNKKINLKVFRLFMTHLYKNENELMQHVVDHYHNTFSKYNHILKYQNIPSNTREYQEKMMKDFMNHYEDYPLRNKPLFSQDINPTEDVKWRSIYYHHLFGGNSPQIIKQACEEYITGLGWIVDYYFDTDITNIDNIWFYHYAYAPTAYDIHKYLYALDKDFLELQEKNKSNYVIEPYMQLLLVLPPQSINLLPKHLKGIMTDIRLGCVHLYPYKFQVETYLKHKLWECTPILPFIDLHKIVSAYEKITS